jgi:hypothetical protein
VITASSRRFARCVLTGTFLIALALEAAPALAAEPSPADRETARALMEKGDQAFDASDFPRALEHYKAAHALVELPSTGVWVVKTLEKLGRLIEARDLALAASRLPVKPDERRVVTDARAESADLAQRLAPRIPSLEVQVTGLPSTATYQLTVDGTVSPPELVRVARKVDPGLHKVIVRAAGFRDGLAERKVNEREAATITIELEKAAAGVTSAPPTESGGVHPLMWVGVSFTGAGLLAGAIAGGISLAAASSAKDLCGDDDYCPSEAASDIETSKTTAWVSNIGFGVAGAGAVLLIVGLVLPTEPAREVASHLCAGSRGTIGPCFRF